MTEYNEMLTFKDAKDILAKYAGSGGFCPDDQVNLFTRKVLQFLLISGAAQDLRRFDFVACKGVFTVPEEVEAIIKLKVNGRVGNVWDKWFNYHNVNYLDGQDCICPVDNALYEDPNYYPTAYDVPSGGARIGILGHCKEECDAHAIIQGKDLSGRQIFTVHGGQQIDGEYLSIKKGMLIYSEVNFATIDNVILSKTNGYKTLYALCPGGSKSFLSDYSPIEEKPTFRRYRLTNPDCCPFASVSILARVRLKSAYSDNDRIPFENLFAIELAGQTINAEYNNDSQTAGAKLQMMDNVVKREQDHKKVQTGIPINIATTTSPSRVRNVIGGWGYGLFGNLWNRNGR